MGQGVDKIEELFSKAGQCLFLTQRIESMFKLIFPFVSDDVDPKPALDLEVFTHRKESIENKTLGCVVNLLKQKEFGLCQRTSVILSEFIDMRNHFVHHMLSPSHFSLTSRKDLDEAFDFLDQYLNAINSVTDIFEPMMLWLFDIIISSSPDNPNLAEAKELLDGLYQQRNLSIKHLEWDDMDGFFGQVAEARSVTEGRHVNKREIWKKTAIIKAIYKAIEKCDHDDEGWVLLSACGTKMASYSELRKDDYGFNKLSELIKASELFEVYHDKNNAGGKIQVKIRKKSNVV